MGSRKTFSEDLELITGIGPDAREWLAENFDVRTFAALADLSVEELVRRIKAENKPWIRWAKDWPAEAAKMVAEREAEAEARQQALASGRRNKDGWDTLAYYVIEFQSRQVPEKPVEGRTTVSYQGPGPETLPVPVERDRLCDWIFEHFDGVVPSRPETATRPDAEVAIAPEEASPLTISISQLCLFQPTGASSPLFSYSSQQPRTSTVRSDQPFDLEAIFEGVSPPASTDGRGGFDVQFLVKDLGSRNYITLGDVRPEATEVEPAYSALLRGVSLPRGKYQLRVLVTAYPEPVVLNSIDIRMLSVW